MSALSSDMFAGKKISVVLPAYNAASTLAKTVADIPELVDDIILVDDKSHDETISEAKKLGLFVYSRPSNGGYGANQKDCYRLALERGADIIIMIHPDYQYDPKLINYFVPLLADNVFDLMLGTRIRSRREALAGGMPMYKYISNRALSFFQNLVTGYNLSEWHTGMRAYTKEVLCSVPFEKFSDDFVFDSQMLFAAAARRYRIGEIPAPVRYFKEASSINFRRSLGYGLGTLREGLLYIFKKP